MPHFWKDWITLRRIWWVQALYVVFLLGSYAIFAYVIAAVWLVATPSLMDMLLIGFGGCFGTIGIGVSVLDCIVLCFRRSIGIVPESAETPPVQIVVQTPVPNQLAVLPHPRPLGRLSIRSVLGAPASEQVV